MASPATLALGPCAGLAPSQAGRAIFPTRPSHLLPPTSVHLQASSRRPNLHLLRNHLPAVRAVAVDSDQLGSSQPAEQVKPRKYYFVVANAKFMLDEEEHFKELLFEKQRNYEERNKEQDFWLVVEPKFLDKFPNITKRLKRPAVALVSTNGPWITFMKLRLDRVLADNFEADSLKEALAYNPVDLQFEKPEKWAAPYPKYEFGWWEPFLPPGSNKVMA
ncbi:uncharacterized protein LOC103715221 [Phoenix dactylifera]|uniref:Uncharacterized protein LOC103715221 n=1 Tax=Phoenix dactylifera TaxID=42345 RepID=A0A8B7CKG3_PHODC|nr:uncharacterized protein LOC103715221 [Phoenix dactylifera]XP_038980390.1 uncharacterized protein LOC103715221 [Phoenix dactylifera]